MGLCGGKTNGGAGPDGLRVAVVGAGPAGITAAYQLSKSGVAVDVYEASSQVGGLSRTIELWGQNVDLGPHRFFSSDSRINRLWLEVANGDYEMVDRLTRIYYRGKFFHYPLRVFGTLRTLGFFESAGCVVSYVREKFRIHGDVSTFEGWVVRRFGRRLFEIFFKTYSEKLWGIRCDELDADFAAQRIKKLSLFEAVKNAFLGGRGNRHKTLVDQFAYPEQGAGMIYERMAGCIAAASGNVFLNTPVEAVLVEGGRVHAVKLEGGSILEYDRVISTMPLSRLITQMPNVPEAIYENASSLRFRNTILVYLKVDAEDLFPDNWLYVHSAGLKTGRVTNFRNWIPQINAGEKESILAMEYWCFDEDELWSVEDDELVEMASAELASTGLTKGAAVLDGHVFKIPWCYPVYASGYKEKLSPIQEYVDSIENLYAIGRYGSFKYNNQDHSILMGLLATENITESAGHDLWEVNTDYDGYQEESVITETGLVVSGQAA